MCIKVAIFLMLYTYNYLRIPCILAVYRQYVYNFSGRSGFIHFITRGTSLESELYVMKDLFPPNVPGIKCLAEQQQSSTHRQEVRLWRYK